VGTGEEGGGVSKVPEVKALLREVGSETGSSVIAWDTL
jgi:hypothetical protein